MNEESPPKNWGPSLSLLERMENWRGEYRRVPRLGLEKESRKGGIWNDSV
jgi:hypothetical protein